jgi:GxxExxY protein
MDRDILFKNECYEIVGACIEVYNEKGSGFLEAVYQECLGIEFLLRKVPYVAQPQLELAYKGRSLTQKYVPDYICHDQIIVELKVAKQLTDEHRAQVFNYLKATGFRLGVLINFGHYPKLEWERIIL